MPFPIDLQKNMARTQRLVKNSDFFTNGLILVIHIIHQRLVMTWKLLHHLKHPRVQGDTWELFLLLCPREGQPSLAAGALGVDVHRFLFALHGDGERGGRGLAVGGGGGGLGGNV